MLFRSCVICISIQLNELLTCQCDDIAKRPMASNAIERSMFLHNYRLKFTIELKGKEPVLEVILDFELLLDFVCCENN